MIKDSGDRTEFETGAKRDMHAGKGRMDLLPWYGIIEVSKHCEEGALKYGEHNVDKGIPLHSLLDSASRHLAKYMVGMDDEDHLRAACWNLLWALNQRETHPELDDRFSAKPDQDQESLDKLAVRTRCLKCGDVHKFYKPSWDDVPYLYESDVKIAMCPRCREKTAHFTMVKAEEDKKKNHQVLCRNCGATIIKENGQICDCVAWRVDVSNEKVELKCHYCNHSAIVSVKDIVDERVKGKTDE